MTDYDYKHLTLYSNLLSKAGNYANQRGLTLFAPDGTDILNQYDQEKWEDERVKGYNVVFHLCQFWGLTRCFLSL